MEDKDLLNFDVDAFLAEGYNELREQELVALSKPPASQQYNYTYVSMPEVERNIDEYIIPELQEACKTLWSKNVFTFMCSNRNDGGAAYIILEKLSPENQAIFEKLKKKSPANYLFDTYRNANRIQIPCVTDMSYEEISKEFLKLISPLKPQEVQSRFYISKEDYLISQGCYDEVPNPDYDENPGPMPTTADLKILDAWFAKCNTPATLKVFNPNKMTKSFEGYVLDNGDLDRTDLKSGKVYENAYFLDKQKKYEKNLKRKVNASL